MWDLKIVFAQLDGDNWVWNESFVQKKTYIHDSEDPLEIFKQECQAFYTNRFLNQCEIVNDGDVIELQYNGLDVKGKPVFAMVKEDEYV